jgi:hypothetical protein
MVNRVWLHHFGEGLVRTPSDFGLRGEPPTHAELLDWLARRFADNWSVKDLHRVILQSLTYRQRSDDRADGVKVDPENRLLWKMNRRRLDFEAMRDGLLAVSGRLDRKMRGPAVDIVGTNPSSRRSLYGFIDRQNLPGLFRTFDLASPDAHTPQRHRTTVPQQALFLMNSPFVVESARSLLARPDIATQTDPARRIERMYRVLYGRGPEPDEAQLGMRFVMGASKEEARFSAWEQYTQVLLLANEFAFVD